MAKRKYTKSDEEIVALVDAKVRYCAAWYDSKLSRERELVTDYYNSKKPLQQHKGSTTFISSDVYDSVEMMKAQLLETFSAGNDIVSFDPVGPEDVEQARECTAYTKHMIFDKNEDTIFGDIIHDGLTARVGVCKVYWEELYDEEEETFENLPYEQVQALAADEEVDSLEAEVDDELAQTYSGSLIRKRDVSRVTIDVLPPEEVLIEERATSIKAAKVMDHRTLKTRSDLYKLGFKKSKVDRLQFDDETSLDLTPEAQARRNATGTGQTLTGDQVQRALQYCILHETYAELDLEKDGIARLYKIVWSGKEIFDIEQVDRKPFKAFVPLPLPHMFYGNNYAMRVVPHQTARTALTRSVLDHAAITNNPRIQVVKGALLNPRELLDNRLGGIVNVNRVDGLAPMPQAPLNPFIFEILGMVKDSREETTGISSLSQGLNKDAISKQNSEGLIDKMVTVSQQRQKIIARQFAKFLAELWLEVYRLIIENEKKERIFEYCGNYVTVNPTDWIERKDVSTSIHVGYGEQEKEAAKYVGLYDKLASDPTIAPLFSINKRHKLATDAIMKQGIKNVDDYLERPEAVQPPGPDPVVMKELEIKDKQAEAAMLNAKVNLAKVQGANQIELEKLKNERIKLSQADFKIKTDATRQDADVANRIDVSQREMELAEKVPPEGQRGIFSPNS